MMNNGTQEEQKQHIHEIPDNDLKNNLRVTICKNRSIKVKLIRNDSQGQLMSELFRIFVLYA
jgi:hypothetical protein